MRKILQIIFLFLPVFAYCHLKTIKIAVPNDLIPYSYVDDKQEIKGLLIDFWKLWAKKNNTKIEFVISSWPETIENLKNKKADLHFGIFYEKSREKYLAYIKNIYQTNSNIYVKNSSSIKSIKDLENKELAVIKNSFYDLYLSKNHKNIKLHRFSKFSDLIKAVNEKKVDAVFNESLTSWHQLLKSSDFYEYRNLENFNIKRWFFATVLKENVDLKSFVEKGFNNIQKKELLEIENKWVKKESLKTFKSNNNILNSEEVLYLEKKDSYISVHKGWNLMSFIDKKGVLTGFHIDLLKEINKNLNTNIKTKLFNNWSESYKAAKNGDVDGIFGLSKTKKREKYFSYSDDYYFTPYYLVARDDNTLIEKISAYDNKIAIIQKSSAIYEVIKRSSNNIKILYSKNKIDSLEKVRDKKADFTIKEYAGEFNLKKFNLKIKKTLYLKEGELYIGTNIKDKIFANIMKKAIKSIDKISLKNIKNKWSKKEKIIFTKEELKYIKNGKILRIGIENAAPIISLNSLNDIEGITGDIFKKVLEFSSLKYVFVNNSWKNLLNDFKNKKIDILPTATKTKEREKYGEFSNSYVDITSSIFVKKTNYTINSMKDLKNKRLAVISSYVSISLIKKKFPLIKIIETNNIDDSINKLLNNEVDGFFSTKLVLFNKENSLLQDNIKEVKQSSIPVDSLSLLSIKGDLLLKSILQKSLYSIPTEEKQEIINKWIKKDNEKQSVNIALKMGREPYVIRDNNLKGIDYELIKLIFSKSNITISKIEFLSNNELESALQNNTSLDLSVNVKNKKKKYFYSNEYLQFKNVVISRIEDNIKIDNINDLKYKKVTAFETANMFLFKNDKYFLNKKNTLYKEEILQEIQVQNFLDKKTDIIIMDLNIFKWFLKKLSVKELSDFRISDIFTNSKIFNIEFKSKQIRDIFNKNLLFIKKSGEYNKILNSYLEDDIISKSYVNSFIISLIPSYIEKNNLIELKKILYFLSNLQYINKIEVFDNSSSLLFTSSSKKFNNSMKSNIYIEEYQNFKKVGLLKVYYNESELDNYALSLKLIPKLSDFKEFDSYYNIKKIYKNKSYNVKKLTFTKKEKEFIKNNPVINFSKVSWEPLSFVINNEFTGFLADYINIIESQTGISFNFVNSSSWEEILNKYKKNEIDMIPASSNIPYKTIEGNISKTIEKFNMVLVMNNDASFEDNIENLKNKVFAIPRNYTSFDILKQNYPNIKIIETKDHQEAFTLISKNLADVTFVHEAVAIYNIRNFYHSLKIVGVTKFKFYHNFFIQKKYPELLSIINKVLKSLTFEEKETIKDKWIKNKISTAIDYTVLYSLVLVFLIILLIIFYFLRKIEIEKKKFKSLFNDTSDAITIIKNGKYIDANQAFLVLLNFKNKDDFLSVNMASIAPLYQSNGISSQECMNEFLEICNKKGNITFEWLSKKRSGELVFLEILITKITSDTGVIFHAVCRDISVKKTLEKEIKNRAAELEKSNLYLQKTITDLNEAQNKLIDAEKMASLGALVAGVAHEINTPVGISLTGITHLEDSTKNLRIKYNQDKMSEDDFEDYLKSCEDLSSLIHSNLIKAASLVKSFKQVAVDQSSEEKRFFNLLTYTNEVLKSIHSFTKKSNVKIVIDCKEDYNINSYPGSYSQIITNLVMNSLIHGYEKEQKGLILINIRYINNEVTIIYKDDGIGIKKENIKKIFDPFFTTNRKNGGSGLGLNIIYNIITSKLKGSIICKSEENEGVEFTITLKK